MRGSIYTICQGQNDCPSQSVRARVTFAEVIQVVTKQRWWVRRFDYLTELGRESSGKYVDREKMVASTPLLGLCGGGGTLQFKTLGLAEGDMLPDPSSFLPRCSGFPEVKIHSTCNQPMRRLLEPTCL